MKPLFLSLWYLSLLALCHGSNVTSSDDGWSPIDEQLSDTCYKFMLELATFDKIEINDNAQELTSSKETITEIFREKAPLESSAPKTPELRPLPKAYEMTPPKFSLPPNLTSQ